VKEIIPRTDGRFVTLFSIPTWTSFDGPIYSQNPPASIIEAASKHDTAAAEALLMLDSNPVDARSLKLEWLPMAPGAFRVT
jgi:hypothetical protein